MADDIVNKCLLLTNTWWAEGDKFLNSDNRFAWIEIRIDAWEEQRAKSRNISRATLTRYYWVITIPSVIPNLRNFGWNLKSKELRLIRCHFLNFQMVFFAIFAMERGSAMLENTAVAYHFCWLPEAPKFLFSIRYVSISRQKGLVTQKKN